MKHYPLVNQRNYGKSPFFMGKSTISMAIFNSYVSSPEGTLLTKWTNIGNKSNKDPSPQHETPPFFGPSHM